MTFSAEMMYPVRALYLLPAMATYCSAYHGYGQDLAFSNPQTLTAQTHSTPFYHTAPIAPNRRFGKPLTANLQPIRRQFGVAGNFIGGLFNPIFNGVSNFFGTLLPATGLATVAGVLVPIIGLAVLLTVLFGLVANQPDGSGRGLDLDLLPTRHAWTQQLEVLEGYLASSTTWTESDPGTEDLF